MEASEINLAASKIEGDCLQTGHEMKTRFPEDENEYLLYLSYRLEESKDILRQWVKGESIALQLMERSRDALRRLVNNFKATCKKAQEHRRNQTESERTLRMMFDIDNSLQLIQGSENRRQLLHEFHKINQQYENNDIAYILWMVFNNNDCVWLLGYKWLNSKVQSTLRQMLTPDHSLQQHSDNINRVDLLEKYENRLHQWKSYWDERKQMLVSIRTRRQIKLESGKQLQNLVKMYKNTMEPAHNTQPSSSPKKTLIAMTNVEDSLQRLHDDKDQRLLLKQVTNDKQVRKLRLTKGQKQIVEHRLSLLYKTKDSVWLLDPQLDCLVTVVQNNLQSEMSEHPAVMQPENTDRANHLLDKFTDRLQIWPPYILPGVKDLLTYWQSAFLVRTKPTPSHNRMWRIKPVDIYQTRRRKYYFLKYMTIHHVNLCSSQCQIRCLHSTEMRISGLEIKEIFTMMSRMKRKPNE